MNADFDALHQGMKQSQDEDGAGSLPDGPRPPGQTDDREAIPEWIFYVIAFLIVIIVILLWNWNRRR